MDLMNENAQEFGPPKTQDANHNHFHQQQETMQPSPTFPTSPLPTPTLLASPLAPVQQPLPSPIGELPAPGPLPRCSTPPSEPGPSTSVSIKHVPTATGRRMGRPPGTYKKAVFEIDPTQKPVIVKDRSSRLAKSRDTPSPDPDEENLDVEPIKECKWGECDRTFSTHSALIEHFRRVHHPQLHATKDRVLDKFSGTMERVWYCKWKGGCNRTEPFRASYMLVVHARSHTGDKPNRCPYDDCNKAYSRLENLKVHVRSHTGERPYICQFPGCMKACSSSADRNKHQKRTHSDEKPYLCMVGSCKKRYTDPSSVRKHIKTVHGEEEYERVKKNRPMNLGGRQRKHRMDHFHKRHQMAAEVVAYQEAMRQRRIEEQRPHFPMPNPQNCSFQAAMCHVNMRQQMAAEMIAYQAAMRQRWIEEQRPHFPMPSPQNCSFQAAMHHVAPVFHGSSAEYHGQLGVADYYEPFCTDSPSLDVANEPGHFPGMGDDYLDRYGLPSPNNVPDVPEVNSLAGSMSYSC